MTTYSANANSNDKVVKLTFCFQYINSQKSSPITPLCILLCDAWWSQFWLLTFNLLRTMLMKNFVNHGIRVAHYIDESVQERRNSSALAWSYFFLALTHRYKDITFISVTADALVMAITRASPVMIIMTITYLFTSLQNNYVYGLNAMHDIVSLIL